MAKFDLHFNLPVAYFKEKKRHIAYSPALDLSTSGRTAGEAKKRFIEAAEMFLEEIIEKGTADEVLENLGWRKVNKEWKPSLKISKEPETVRVPVAV
jgi:hypothetical protein